MNLIYKIKWCAHRQTWIAVSEFARGKVKGALRGGVISVVALSGVTAAFADEIQNYNPYDNDDEVGAIIVTGNSTFTNNSAGEGFNALETGDSGRGTTTIGEAYENGQINESADVVGIGQDSMTLPGKNAIATYYDPVTQTTVSVPVYNSDYITDQSVDDISVAVIKPVGDAQYVDMRLATVQSGGTLDVNVGSTGDNWMDDPANTFNANIKESTVFMTEDGGTTNYNSKTIVHVNPSYSSAGQAASTNYNITTYNGTFTDSNGIQHTVNNIDDFKAYNDFLISEINEGTLSPSEYDSDLSLAYTNTTTTASIDGNFSPEDESLASGGKYNNFFLGANGTGVINITEDASIQAEDSSITLIRLQDNAVANNYGELGVTGSGYSDIARTYQNSTFNNYGVMDVGNGRGLGESTSALGGGNGVSASNSSHVNNYGIINVATAGPNSKESAGTPDTANSGIKTYSTSTAYNAGIINVSTSTGDASTPDNYFASGMHALDNSSVTNDGVIYIGREAMGATDDAAADVSVSQQSVGIDGEDNSTVTTTADSVITIGSKAENAAAIWVHGEGVTLSQAGTLELDGQSLLFASMMNMGIYATDGAGTGTTSVENSGTIDINGTNTAGIYVDQSGKVTNTGTINVNRGYDFVTKSANYAMIANGSDATVYDSGTVNLNDDYAIGNQARNGGTIELGTDEQMNFNSGTNQTGYLVYGEGSQLIDNSGVAVRTIATTDSTLIRVDGGADYTSTGSATLTADAAGQGSSVIQVTGNGSTLTSGAMNLTASGQDATAIRVEGGATAELTADTTIVVTGNGATAATIDGNYYDINGETDDSLSGQSILMTEANLTSGNVGSGSYGYIVKNNGLLVQNGTIDLTSAGSTGVMVDGGTMENNSSITANGTAVYITGPQSSVVTNNADATVMATDGTAAYRIDNGASLELNGTGVTQAGGTADGILLDTGAAGLTVTDATITMLPGGTGSGINNKAEIGGIQLNNTTINVADGNGIRTGTSLAAENSGTINVEGSGTGILFENADGSTTDGALDMSQSQNLVINVNNANGSGITTNTTGDVSTGVSINVNAVDGGPALVVGGTTSTVEQSGNIQSASTASQVIDIDSGNVTSFTNSGSITASSTDATVMSVTQNGLEFTNQTGGSISGIVSLTGGDNTVTLEHGSTATDFVTGSGTDEYRLVGTTADEALFTSIDGGQGDDTLLLDNSAYTLTDESAIQNIEHVDLTSNSVFTLDNTMLDLSAQGSGYQIDEGSTLAINNTADISFDSHLAGEGDLQVNLSGNTFNFTDNNANNGFAGTLDLTDTQFRLDGTNTIAMTDATVKAGEGSTVVVGEGVQNIDGLAFNGGTVVFDTKTLGQATSDASVHTTSSLDLTGPGYVQVTVNPYDNMPAPDMPDNTLSLLQQDDAQVQLQLADTDGVVTGSAGNLVLVDENGDVISDGVTSSVVQNGTTVANATYDYRLTGGDNSDGLYINYGLTSLDLLTSGSDALVLSTGSETGAAADLSAQVTGSGDLAIDTGTGNVLSLSNMDNDYTGVTDVRSGTMLMNNDNVLGQTSELAMATSTGFEMNGFSQTVGSVDTEAGSMIDIGGGALTIETGGTMDGSLEGSGELNIDGGQLMINGANTSLSANTTIAAGADVQLNDTTGLGGGAIADNGSLNINSATGILYNALSGTGDANVNQNSDVTLVGDNSGFAGQFNIDSTSNLTATTQNSLGTTAVDDEGSLTLATDASWVLNNSVSGAGSLNKTGNGVVTLSQGAAMYTGSTTVSAGGLQLGTVDSAVDLASDSVTVAEGAEFGGYGSTTGNVDNSGSLVVGSLDANQEVSTYAAADSTFTPATFSVGGNLNNSGSVYVSQPSSQTAGNTLYVNGDYNGNDGNLYLNTALGGDDSVTDKMIVTGNTSGNTSVTVTNAGGSGAQTIDGIEVIEVDGNSAGEFTQSGRIVAGSYDYYLVRGEGENASNWYLDSNPSDPGPGPDPDPTPDPTPDPPPDVRPEGGAYAANMAAANNLFNMTLHDRLGETHYVDALTGKENVTSLWMRQVGGHTSSKDNSGQNKTLSNRYVVQLGGDVVQWSEDGKDRWHIGAMWGYANQSSNTRNHHNGFSADSSVDGYSVGLYGTWLQNEAEKTGAYVDTWALYNWFDNDVSGEGLATESYKSKGVTASVETGYTWKLGEKSKHESYFIQPQAQVIWQNVKADDHIESNGTRVQFNGDGNIQTRLGVRAFIKGHNAKLDDGKRRTFEPFVEANWIHNTNEFGVDMNGVGISQVGTKNIGELKAGVEAKVNDNIKLWGNVAEKIGDRGYNDTQAMFGMKVSFK